MSGFNYLISYGGGIGPDVWDAEIQINAVDISDAIAQANGRIEESGGWIFMVSQEDYPPSAREKLQSENQSLKTENNVLMHALANCHMMARRSIRKTGMMNYEARKPWVQIMDFCEKTGINPQILRASVPNEAEEG